MTGERPEPKLSVGDTVRITYNEDCPFGWDYDMEDLADDEAEAIDSPTSYPITDDELTARIIPSENCVESNVS